MLKIRFTSRYKLNTNSNKTLLFLGLSERTPINTYTKYMRFIVGEINTDIVYEQLENFFDSIVDLVWLIFCPQNRSNQCTILTIENSIAWLLNISEMDA